MPDDAPKLLAKHVVPPLLRALATIRRRPQPPRLVLKRAEYGRAPGWDDQNDFDVLWRDRVVGRIHRYDRYDEPGMKGFAWHWYWREAPDRKDARGSAHSLEEAMSDFRNAWDDADPSRQPRTSGSM